MDDELTLSVEEAGRLLHCGRRLAYRLAHEGKLPVLRLGRKLRVSRPALDRMLENVGTDKALPG